MIKEIKLTNGFDEEQILALIEATLAISDKTGLHPEEVLRNIKSLETKGLISVIQKRNDKTGRLEIGFQLHVDD